MKIVIIGGVAGGATAAARLRRLNEDAQIIMFEKDEYISFANCGLPYHISGVIEDRNDLLVQTKEGMEKRFNLDIRNFSEVMHIDPSRKVVLVKEVITGHEYEESYDKLILSPGASPIVPPIQGLKEANNVFILRNIPHTDAIMDFLKNNDVKKVAVIGGGFIGVEVAENLKEIGKDVTIIDMAPQVLAPLDFEFAQIVHKKLVRKGIKLKLNDGVSHFENNGQLVVNQSGQSVETDMIILAIGVSSEVKLAREANLKVGALKGIVVDEHMLTSDPDIYALGDAVEVKHRVSGLTTKIPLAWPANRQAIVVANHICGIEDEYKGSLGTAVVKVFDLTVATTGLNERTLKQLNYPVKSVHVQRNNHASYYPNAKEMNLKLIFNPDTGQIYGAQGVGYEGVEKRIDVIATAILGGLKAQDLLDLELSYAPPFGSAKDPVNILGYVASNILSGRIEKIDVLEVNQLISSGAFFLDVRTPDELSYGFIKGSTNIELDELRSRLDELPSKETPIYVTCRVGHRGYVAAMMLNHLGYHAINVDGGYDLYKIASKQY
ncbi:MAG: CoA-disulfide reductase [Erysipelothrix sp.]|jgi:CoA-disulfide reductase|nr:CoA-disulfide reductase [Erysipelothrix sp.]